MLETGEQCLCSFPKWKFNCEILLLLSLHHCILGVKFNLALDREILPSALTDKTGKCALGAGLGPALATYFGEEGECDLLCRSIFETVCVGRCVCVCVA